MKRFFVSILISHLIQVQAQNTPNSLLLEDIWQKNEFKEKRVEALRFMKDSRYYTVLESDEKNRPQIVKYAIDPSKPKSVLLDGQTLAGFGVESLDDYALSADEQRIVLYAESEAIFRHSTAENVYVYDLLKKTFTKISTKKIRLATLSPNGKYMAYVLDNNLYYYDIETQKENKITHDGQKNVIINGATDWVYEEEFAFDKAFDWSSDGERLAFYRFDEANVREFSMDMFMGGLYPTQNKFKYPKAGEQNAQVSLLVYDLAQKQLEPIQIPNSYEYIPRLQWSANPLILTFQTLNRHQSDLSIYAYHAANKSLKQIYQEVSDTYVDVNKRLYFSTLRPEFYFTSEQSGYNHIYKCSLEGGSATALTSGAWDVVDILATDDKQSFIYYSSKQEGPQFLQVYKTDLKGKAPQKISAKKGWHRAVFSSDAQYWMDYYSNFTSPTEVSLMQASGKLVRVIENNEALKNKLAQQSLSKPTFFSFKTRQGIDLNAWMIKPQNFQEGKKYPVLMYVYGGPGAQTVEDSWEGNNYLWYQYLAQQGYVVVSVDNRGTGGRGAAFKKCTYKQLGALETQDQMEAAHYLGSLAYIDKNRIGIQGWSYGGYMSSLCLMQGADYFKMGIAVAPVTHWKFYDSIYTERYMQTPSENPKGYEDFAPINLADKLRGAYLLVHGSADDNVHYQNSVEMANALIKAGKQYDFYLYPDRAHGISGGNARFHLYQKMTQFILSNL